MAAELPYTMSLFFFFSSRRRHTRLQGDWSSDVCSSDLEHLAEEKHAREAGPRSPFRRKSSCAVSSRASSHVASRNGSDQDGGGATPAPKSRSTRARSGRAPPALPPRPRGAPRLRVWAPPPLAC